MRIAVLGVGGVGGSFGGGLAQAGEDVIFIARGAHLQAMQEHGLRVESIKGDFVVSPIQATDDASRIGAVDVVLVGVKAWQLQEITSVLPFLLGPSTCVVPLQNGLEAPAQLAEVIGIQHVLGGTCAIYSYRSAPGCIRHIGLEPSITIGELEASSSARSTELKKTLEGAGINAMVAPDIRVPMWEKFLILRWGVIGALTRAPAEVLRSLPQTREMIQQACQEVVTVAEAYEVHLSEEILVRNMELLDSLPASATTSLQRDLMEGYPSELDAQAGVMVRLGETTGTAVPLHRVLYHSLLPMEMKARGQIVFPA